MKRFKFTAAIAAILTLALMTGCSDGGNEETATDTGTGNSASTEINIENMPTEEEMTTRALEEGDMYAIYKINNKTEGETLPGGYKLMQTDEGAQGKLYVNGGSKVVIRAQNYKEDMQDMATWADNACAMVRIANITSACDTVFQDPQNTKVCGYDAIMYDYDVLQYEFVDETTKNHTDTFKGRNYYFYSDQDAYVLSFDTNDEDWEEQVKCFEEFVADLEITPTEY